MQIYVCLIGTKVMFGFILSRRKTSLNYKFSFDKKNIFFLLNKIRKANYFEKSSRCYNIHKETTTVLFILVHKRCANFTHIKICWRTIDFANAFGNTTLKWLVGTQTEYMFTGLRKRGMVNGLLTGQIWMRFRTILRGAGD